MDSRRFACATLTVLVLSACAGGSSPAGSGSGALAAGSAQRCRVLADGQAIRWPEAGTRLTGSVHREAALEQPQPGPPGVAMPRASLPAHCDITGVMQERKGVD